MKSRKIVFSTKFRKLFCTSCAVLPSVATRNSCIILFDHNLTQNSKPVEGSVVTKS